MMNKIGRKSVAGLEIVLMMVSFFALCHFVDLNEVVFEKLEGPLIPIVSAFDYNDNEIEDDVECRGLSNSECFNKIFGSQLIESETWTSYPISSQAEGVGCCFLSTDGQVCGAALPENCFDDSPFSEGALCRNTQFCQKGCCYDESSGIYDKNVLDAVCSVEWIDDENCNLPGASRGCCVLGSETEYETYQQCVVASSVRALGNSDTIDWKGNVGEGDCFLLAAIQKKGACVLDQGACEFVTEADCFSYDGVFNEGVLCTSESLNTNCEMTQQTRCVDGKYGVYFVDSCGNTANIYDSSRVNNVAYWNEVVNISDSCGSDNIETGNADSADCGNCDLQFGGICASASEDDFDVELGDFYCKSASCVFGGESYRNTESWCVYDGAIGNGDDVPGSRHWKYSCNRGVVEVVACGDARSQICVQSTELEINKETIDFNSAACVMNNWQECINLNSGAVDESGPSVEECLEEDFSDCYNETAYPSEAERLGCVEGIDTECDKDRNVVVSAACEDALNCRMENINIADKFKFDVCLPEYPIGFDFKNEDSQAYATATCRMASQTCTVVRKPKTWEDKCEYVANEDCLEGVFAQEMNDFCRGLGDCGGSVNIEGEWSGNYLVSKSPDLSAGWIAALSELANPVDGQYAEVEDYSRFLKAAGVWKGNAIDTSEEDTDVEFEAVNNLPSGLGGIGMAAWLTKLGIGYFGTGIGASGMAGLTTSNILYAGASAFSNVAMGAAVGMMAGAALAKHMKLSPGGSMLMAVGGGLIAGAYVAVKVGMISGPVGWVIAIIGIILIVVATFFAGKDCPPIEVKFTCSPWQPVSGGASCEECNGNPLKPCSEYRCESLGARCEFINIGSEDETCVDSDPRDVSVPTISRNSAITTIGIDYVDKSDGFNIKGTEEECIPAYTPFEIAITTSEHAQCRFGFDASYDFDEMVNIFGSGSSYVRDHSVIYQLPDPSHGESQGWNWSSEMSLFIKCRDRSGLKSPGAYEIGMCVIEGDDVTAPAIADIYPNDGTMVGLSEANKTVTLVTYELATCRWDLADVEYLDMENSFRCRDFLGSPSHDYGYKCTGKVPVENDYNTYYIRCMDQPWLTPEGEEESRLTVVGRNANAESTVLNLKRPVSKISIDKILPKSGFETGTATTTINLKIATSGGGDFHFCAWSLSGYETMNTIIGTGITRIHEIPLNQGPGPKTIYVKCWDETGDFDENMTSFTILRDNSPPSVSRIWQSAGYVNIVLNEEGTCKYSLDGCRFAWGDGVDIGTGDSFQFGAVKGETYYIRCQDEFENGPGGCSIQVLAL